MSRRGGRQESRNAADNLGRRRRRPPDSLDLRALLREAEEALRQTDLPSGDWGAEGQGGAFPTGSVDGLFWSESLAGGQEPGQECSREELEPGSPLWLLFRPRGNA